MMTQENYLLLRKSFLPFARGQKGIFDFIVTLFVFYVSLLPWISSFFPGYLKFLSPILLAVSMYRSFSLFHEGVHRTLHQNYKINNLISIFVSPLCLLPFDAWKSSHLLHHRWSGNIEKDPVMAFVKIYPQLNSKFKNFLNLSWKFWIPVLSITQYIVFWTISAKLTFSEKKISHFFSFLYPLLIWSFVIYVCEPLLLIGFIFPSVYLYLLGTEIINLPHHLQLDFKFDETRYPIWQQYKTARSCLYPRFISRHIVLNFNFHIEHHMFPDAPWYLLDQIQKKVIGELGTDYNSEKKFSWILNARNLNLSEVLSASKNQANIKTAS